MFLLFGAIRTVATLILGIVIFLGFLFLLGERTFSANLLNADFYKDTISGQDTYNRIYDQVLLDQELQETTRGLLGGIQVLSHQDVVQLLREIVPPEYLQSQVEDAIQRSVDYLSEDADTLELYLDLGPPLDLIKPTLLAYVDRRIDAIPEDDPGLPECSLERVKELAEGYLGTFKVLSSGELPDSLPSIKGLSQPCRELIFDSLFGSSVASSPLESRAQQGLMNSREAIRAEFVAGNTHGVLKQALRPLATPLMDDAIDKLKENLDSQNRLDLIQKIAEWNPDFTEEELRAQADESRRLMNRVRGLGETAAIIMVVGGAVAMVLVHYPKVSGGMRWAGIAYLVTGGVFFGIGKVLESQLPARLTLLVERGAGQVSGIPVSLATLATDLIVSFAKQLTGGMAAPSLTLLTVGAVLFGVSFAIAILRPLLPGIR